jgi:hypothetical protein
MTTLADLNKRVELEIQAVRAAQLAVLRRDGCRAHDTQGEAYQGRHRAQD